MQHKVRINWDSREAEVVESPYTVRVKFLDGAIELTLAPSPAASGERPAYNYALAALETAGRDVVAAGSSFLESLPNQPPEAVRALFSEKLVAPLAILASLLEDGEPDEAASEVSPFREEDHSAAP